jgi:hypothetical protein
MHFELLPRVVLHLPVESNLAIYYGIQKFDFERVWICVDDGAALLGNVLRGALLCRVVYRRQLNYRVWLVRKLQYSKADLLYARLFINTRIS